VQFTDLDPPICVIRRRRGPSRRPSAATMPLLTPAAATWSLWRLGFSPNPA